MKRIILSLFVLALATGGAVAQTVEIGGTPYATIQDAIDAATPGDTITLSAGTFVASAQIVINKNLTIIGAGATATVIEPGFNTTVGYYLVSDALMYVDYGVTAVIEDLAIDGSGFTVRHAIQSRGTDLTVRNCEIRDIYANIYAGRGIVFLMGTGLVENCVMSNIQRIGVHIRGAVESTVPDVDVDGLTYTGKGAGDFLDYGVEFGGGGTGTVTNSAMTACMGIALTDSSTSAGILVTDYYGTGTAADITNTSLTGNDNGLFVGYITEAHPVDLSVVTIHDCTLSGNSNAGVNTAGPAVDAEGNYWASLDPAAEITGAGSVDYSPWYELPLGSSPQDIGTNDSIKDAIALALGGDTINVAGGMYVEPGQIVVDKDLSIIGDVGDRPIVMTDTDTGSSGDARGWFLQTSGTTLVMSNMELDGSGHLVYQGIRTTGNGDLNNCALRNITFNESGPTYGGVAIAAFSGDYWNVTGCTFDNIGRIGLLGWTDGTFSGNTYTGKGPGDWLDYAIDTNAGTVMLIEGNTITACQGVASSDGSTSAAIIVGTLFGPGTTATLNNNVLTGNSYGLEIGYDANDTSVVVGRGNDISGNDSYGVGNTSALNSVDFLGNWWGDASGPYHPTLNPAGTGNAVGDNILFEPWTGMAGGGIVPASTGPLNCSQTITLTFNYTADEYTPDMFGYNAVVSATAGLDFGLVGDLLPFGAVNNNFFAMATGANQWTITGSTVGSPTSPVTGAGTTGLFTIKFSATGDIVGDVVFDSLTLRDPDNAPIPVDLSGATITYDCSAPAAVTAITAAPAHNKVSVTWAHDGDDVAAYEVYRGLWYDTTIGTSAYPEYDDLASDIIPASPATRTAADDSDEWILAGTVAVGTNSFADLGAVDGSGTFDANGGDRGVYYYEVFPVDAATNYGGPAPANDRATNYWLGDVDQSPGDSTPDGTVDGFDINVLGTYFGTAVPLGTDGTVADVGPTDNWSRLGIPLTDSVVNFEDLMVFSLNFGIVSAAKSKAPVGKTVDLAWVNYDDGTTALRLVDGSGLKGLRITANVGVIGVTAGQLLDEQNELTFLKNVGEKLDASVTVMGVNNTFTGTGDLLIVSSSAEIALDQLTITARAIDNSELEINLDSTSGELTPRVFALRGNYPNPFNPQTKISFSLPEAHAVTLTIYGVDGRLVTTLLNEVRGAGLHEVVWTGRDDAGKGVASGTYFFRLDAGPFSDVKKMTLMK